MTQEIETRFLEINKDQIIRQLRVLGAADLGDNKLDEMIFYDAQLKWKTDGNKFLRLRQLGDKVKLTYKERQGQGVEAAQEIEFEVSDLERCVELFSKLDLKLIRRLEKLRHSFRLDGVDLDLDEWPKLPPYLELEGESAEALKKVSTQLGLDWESRFDGDAREVFRHYGYELENLTQVTFSRFG